MQLTKRSWWIIALLACMLLSGLYMPVVVKAQLASQVLINFPQVEEDTAANGLQLSLFFTLLDAKGDVVSGLEPKAAKMLLSPEDGGEVVAQVAKAEGVSNLVLILDTSGSMGSQLANMKAAASTLIDKAPNDTRFTLIRFSSDVEVMVTFTADKDRVKGAIAGLKANGGTCLFDAIKTGLESLKGAAQGRRSVVVFTDGRDENIQQNAPCSQSTRDEVVQLATDPTFNVPIHTIGLGTRVVPDDLILLSKSTRGVSSIGTDINILFGKITDALNSQFVAKALIYPKQGQRSVTLNVTLPGDVAVPGPGTTNFISPKDFSIRPTATPTATATLPPLSVAVDTIQQNKETKQLLVTISTNDEGQIKEYRVNVLDGNGLVVQEKIVPAPLTGTIALPVADLAQGKYCVRVTAITKLNTTARSADSCVTLEQTPLPSATATMTAIPVSVTVEQVTYEDEATKQSILLALKYTSKESIKTLRVVLNNKSGFTVKSFDNLAPDNSVRLELGGVAGGDYSLTITALDANGQAIATTTRDFTYDLIPTSTPSAVPTATPVVVNIVVDALSEDLTAGNLVVRLTATNPQQIERFVVRLFNEQGIMAKEFPFAAPPYDVLNVPVAEIPRGKYRLQVVALDKNGNELVKAEGAEFEYNPPTPTPLPTATPANLVTAVQSAFTNPSVRPIALIVLVAIIGGLLGLMFALTRRPKKVSTGTPTLAQLTGAVNIADLQKQAKESAARSAAAGVGPSIPSPMPPPPRQAPRYDPDLTAAHPSSVGDPDATNAVPVAASMLPPAKLIVEQSRDIAMQGHVVDVTHVPFTLGRRGRDLSFDGDDNVSRQHAEITFENGQFYLTDLGSTHGTVINHAKLTPHSRQALGARTTFHLGVSTVIRFESEAGRRS